jgi:hypothetical protein
MSDEDIKSCIANAISNFEYISGIQEK